MEEYLKNGHARKIPKKSLAPSLKTWYIPHLAIGGTFRIVFDCAVRFRGTSLNDNLLQGPNHASNLVGVLLRFRSRQVAVMADIYKGMFPMASLGLEKPGAELDGVTRLAKAINYSTYKGWRPVEGISHFAERILYCKIDIKNWELGRIEKSCVLL